MPFRSPALLSASLIGMAILFGAVAGSPRPALAGPCARETIEDTNYVVCAIDPGKADLLLFWKGDDGAPYRSFAGIADAVTAKGKTLVFAVNAGMYLEDFSPIGLYVENGRALRPVASIEPPAGSVPVPNFYKRPNGVFLIGDKGAAIMPTETFTKQRPDVRLATQSGPMLVTGGKINPIFIAGSSDRTRRSGVGVCDNGTVRFAISDDPVNFHDFARLFRDRLQCQDALFLDGGGGAGFYSGELGRSDFSWHGGYGPVFGVVE